MTKTELKTIADALETKKTWVKKGFEDMLTVWADTTENMDGIGNVYLDDYTISDSYTHALYLCPGKNNLYFREETLYGDAEEIDYYIDGGSSSCKYRDELTTKLIRFATPRISDAITRKFKRLQAEIDGLSKIGQELQRITNCLNR